jgi:hypothetical protein
MQFIRNTLLMLLLENCRLFAEVNDHRAARGIQPLKQLQVKA